MLEQDITKQLQSVFSQLESEIVLRYYPSDHPKQEELIEMLEGVKATSSKISMERAEAQSQHPRFEILKGAQPTGISFTGIPGGHEFTSLVLAILNADGKGKWPDASLVSRVKALSGKIRLRTFVSLSCENCPQVVQALNQMALIHPDFEHEMIDGALQPETIEALGIQGVPSVMAADVLVHSGKIEWMDLVKALEKFFGREENSKQAPSRDLGSYDVVVIGGGPAGASAAIYSARKGLKTGILAERIGGQVQDTKGIENLISVPYTEGVLLSQRLLEHLNSYPISVWEHRRVTRIESTLVGPRRIELEGGEFLHTESIIVATGAKWRQLGIPGETQYLGRGVAFCPHCDGPFYRGKSVAVVGGGNSGVEAAIDLSGIAKDVVLFEFQDELKADQVLVAKLKSLPNVKILTGVKTKEVIGDGKKVIALEYENRKSGEVFRQPLDGIFVQIGLVPNSGFLKGIVDLASSGEILVDGKGRTSAPQIYAAGDVTTTPFKQIIIAMGEGAKAALTSFEDRMHSSKTALAG